MNFAFPGGRNVVRTTLNRLWLKELVHIDPDVVYFTSRQNSLSLEQKSLLQNLAQICNFKGTSDIPSWLTAAERQSLHVFLETTPEIRRVGRTTFQIDDHLLDYESHIGMPSLPNAISYILGEIVSRLADLPLVMRLFEFYSDFALKKILKQNPL